MSPAVRRVARPAAALLCLLAVLAGVLVLTAPSPAAAQDGDQPLTITVTALAPRTITPESQLTVTGTITNTGDAAIEELAIRLQRGPLLTSRDALSANDEDPSTSASGFGDFAELGGVLDADASMPFRYQTTAADLGLTELGVYSALVNVNGTPVGGVQQRVGQVSTYLPFFPEVPAAPTRAAWLWPLVDRPHRGASGEFLDDDLAGSVAEGGRLDRLLSIAEASNGVPLTLVVDPMLIDALTVMSDDGGYLLADGTRGRGQDTAAAWLERLRGLAAGLPVLSLPYGDLDTVALQRNGLGSQVGPAIDSGATIVADALGITPSEDLGWPVDGVITEAALQLLADTGIDQVVLGADSFEPALTVRTPSAAAKLSTASGEATALVSDPVLDQIVAAAATFATGARLAEQRYLAELAMITAEAPSTTRDVLIAPPRRWDPQPSYAVPMLTATATEPWLAPGNATELAATAEPGDLGPLVYPGSASAEELGGTGMDRLLAGVGALDDFTSMLDASAAEVAPLTAGAQRAVWRASSSYWREDSEGFTAAAERVVAGVEGLRQRVSLVVPATGTYSLASSQAPLVFTVNNQLPVAVQVRIEVRSSTAGLSTEDIGVQTIPPGGRTLIEVPATVQRSGNFRVTAAMSTPGGGTLGEPVALTVRSTAYGVIALIITAAAGALLALLLTRRLVRRVRTGRNRRRAPVSRLLSAGPPDGRRHDRPSDGGGALTATQPIAGLPLRSPTEQSQPAVPAEPAT